MSTWIRKTCLQRSRFSPVCRDDPGVKSFTLITQDPTTNHFQLIEVFRDMRAFNDHVSAEHTIQFRTALQPLLGAPYDERLYRAE